MSENSPYCGSEPCPVLLSSSCVFYKGQDLIYIGVNTNDPLQTVIEKINQAFQNSGVGYAFTNGIIQPTPFDPVQLGGSLIQNTTIGGNYTLTFIGELQAARHITTGGTTSQFVKGDGSLDSTSYQPVGNYLTALSGDGTASGPGSAVFTLTTVNFAPGTFGSGSNVPVVTVDAKGRVTNLTSTPLVVPPQSLTFIGDVVGSGLTGAAVTLSLQNINANVYNTDTALKFSVNSKGLVTSATPLTGTDIDSIVGYTVGNLLSTGSYANPSWITSLAWSKIISSPTTLSGYGITDALDTSIISQVKLGGLTALNFIKSGGTSVQFLKADGSVDSTAYAPINNPVFTGSVTLPGSPMNPLEAATKQYVDDVSQGLDIHAPCVAATTTNLVATYINGVSGLGATLTNNGAQAAIVIDGVTLSLNNRVLVKNQSSQLQNGIYTVTNVGSGSTNWVLTRATDYDQTAEINGDDFVFISSGLTNNNTGWVQTQTSVVIGVSNILFVQFSGAGTYQAGNGLTLSGNIFSINTAVTVDLNTAQVLTNKTITGSFTGNLSGNASTVTNGVYTTGSYSDPTWITGLAWSKILSTPTTLSGYGITDAYTQTQVNTLLSGYQPLLTNPVTGTGTSGQVAFWNGTTSQTGSNNLFWDSANGRLGINTNNPTNTLQVHTGANGVVLFRHESGVGGVRITGTAIQSNAFLYFANNFNTSITDRWSISLNGAVNALVFTDTAERMRIASGGNLLIGTTTDAGFRLDVSGTTRLNGLQTFQGTTASDTAPLGSELATTGSGTNWTGTGFATGYTHTVGSTASLTTSIPAVNGTYYQIAYTITGRTAGSITINYGGTSTASITATGATGPLATSTANLEIVPTTDFDGTLVLSVRSIGTSSATATFTDSGGNSRIQIRATSSSNNAIVGTNAGRRITTGTLNSFFGSDSGRENTTGSSNAFFGRNSGFNNNVGLNNSFFGASSGQSNTTGNSNSFFGTASGINTTTASNNSFFGTASGQSNILGESNSCFGNSSALNVTSGSNNVFVGRNSGRFTSAGSNLTVSDNSILLGFETRPNGDSQTNQTVIGYQAIGLGSNTTVIGNSSTTFGRWWGNLLLGTSTNAGFTLDVAGSTRIVPPADTTGLTLSGYSLTGSSAVPAIDISGTWNTTGQANAIRVNITNTASGSTSNLLNLQVGGSPIFLVRTSSIGGIVTGGPISANGYGLGTGTVGIFTVNESNAYSSIGLAMQFSDALQNSSLSGYSYIFHSGQYVNRTYTSGTGGFVSIQRNFAPTSGTGVLNVLNLQNTINQTGGANGITRGLFVNPTLTSAADWRSIEWSNNTGRGLWGTGTADNAIAGAMHIGSATVPNAVAQLEVSSTTKGFLPPRMTTAQRDLIAAVAGLVIYNTTTNKHQGHNGTAWQDFY